MEIQRSEGTTPSERYLAKLCERTFLSLWSYPNLFRDQSVGQGGHGKELCDLLVVWDQHVVIFSDKSCAFPDSGNVDIDWRRWFKRAISQSARQVFGAERWLRTQPERVFLDGACTQRFPLDLKGREFTFHRVVVALGAKDACQRHLGGSGALVIQPDLIGDDHTNGHCDFYGPFRIGYCLPGKGYVHVFDDVSLDAVLREVDTVTDFIGYLTDKEELIESGRLFAAAGEEHLLAAYLSTYSDDRGHHFDVPGGNKRIVFDDTWWGHFVSSDAYRRKKDADRVSYLWDWIIQDFAQHAIKGTLASGSVTTLAENERLLRVLAQESRFSRRGLAEALVDQQRRTQRGMPHFRTVISYNQPEIAYVSLLFPYRGDDYEQYRAVRRTALETYCLVLAWKRRQHKQVVGIATETGVGEGRSFDLLLFNPGEWTPELEEEAKQIQSKLGILQDENLKLTRVHRTEYPKAPRRSLAQMSEVERLLRQSAVARATGRN
jgi:hypothetical protein